MGLEDPLFQVEAGPGKAAGQLGLKRHQRLAPLQPQPAHVAAGARETAQAGGGQGEGGAEGGLHQGRYIVRPFAFPDEGQGQVEVLRRGGPGEAGLSSQFGGEVLQGFGEAGREINGDEQTQGVVVPEKKEYN